MLPPPEPPPAEPPGTPEAEAEASGRAVVALIFSLLGIAFWCPCVGPVVALALAWDEPSGVARAARILGWVGLGTSLLLGAIFGLQGLLFAIAA